MNLVEIIESRRTVHTYNTKIVDNTLVQKALRCALWAPNHKLTFPWRFIIIGPETRKKLAQVAADVKAEKTGSPVSATQILMTEKTYLTPSHMIGLAIVKSSDPRRMREDYAAMAMGIQNIGLFLWPHQVGTKWSTGAPTMHPRTYEILNVNPDTTELVGYLWVGYFDETPNTPERPNLIQFVTEAP